MQSSRVCVLEPDGPPAGAGCSPPWADRFTLQPPPHRPALLRARLSLDSSEIAWSWHGSGRPDGRRMGRLVGGDAACRERSLQTHWSVGSVAPCRVSLSHVALPFPTSDSLYGLQPDPAENFGINLGAIAARGERGTLIVNLDSLLRMSSNPFFPYLIERIEESIKPSAPREPGTP
jgi:hypothetical protein